MSCKAETLKSNQVAISFGGTFPPAGELTTFLKINHFAQSNRNQQKKIKQLQEQLAQAWCAETSAGTWDATNPAAFQCAVTAVTLQDYLGGDLLRCPMTDGGSHYWNRLPNGQEVDLTAAQFEKSVARPQKETTVVRSRAYVLSFPDTLKRYQLLKQKMEAAFE